MMLQHLVVRVDRAEQVALAHARAGGAADVDLPLPPSIATAPTSLIVASAQFRGQPAVASFILCGRLEPLEALLDLRCRASCCRRRRSGRTRCRRRSCRCGTPSCRRGPTACRGRARRPAGPPCLMPSRSMRWPPVIFTIGTSYFSATSAMRRSSAADGDAAVDARDDAEGAVLLDVRVHAVVDEPRVALVLVLVAPDRLEQRREAGLAAGSSLPAGQRREDGRHALQAALADRRDQLRLVQRHARHVVVRRRIVLHRSPATTSSSACTCVLHEPQPVPARVASHERLEACSARLDRGDDARPWRRRCSCRSARRPAARRTIGALAPRRRREEQLRAVARAAGVPRSNACSSMGAGRRVAEQDRAGQPAVADDQLLVDAARRLGVRARPRRSASAGSFSPITASSTPITFSLVDERRAGVGASRVAPGRAGRPAPASAPTAARRGRRRCPRCWAHSPTAKTRSGRPARRRSSSTTMPRSTREPAVRAPARRSAGCRPR